MLSTRGSWLSFVHQFGRRTLKSLTPITADKSVTSVERCGCNQAQSMAVTRSMSVKVPRTDFKAPSPYKNPGPRRFGYQQEIYDGGLLPRLDKAAESAPEYKVKDSWSKERALFGQNDYIDILGDGNIHPVHLIRAPAWLRGYNGNELQRCVRRMVYEGKKLKKEYPTVYHSRSKRIDFLNKKYNKYR